MDKCPESFVVNLYLVPLGDVNTNPPSNEPVTPVILPLALILLEAVMCPVIFIPLD